MRLGNRKEIIVWNLYNTWVKIIEDKLSGKKGFRVKIDKFAFSRFW